MSLNGENVLNISLVYKVSLAIDALKKTLKEFVDRDALVLVYNALIQPYFDYCCEV